MDILAPVNAAAEVDPLLDCGATELYCGFMPPEQLERYTTAVWMNRRGFRANIHTAEELSEIVERAHTRHVSVFLTLNAPYYTWDQYEDVFFTVEVATKAKIDGLIVADLGILLALREAGVQMELCLSTVGDCYNSQTARFFRELGISRVILPRHLTFAEMKVVGRGKPIELKLRLVEAVGQVVAGLKAGLSPGALKYKSVELMGNYTICQRGFACYYREANPFLDGT